MKTTHGWALSAILLFCSAQSTLAQDGYRYPGMRTARSAADCQCGSSAGVATQPLASSIIRSTTGTDGFLLLAQQARADIRSEMRGARNYGVLLDDADIVVELTRRLRQSYALGSSSQAGRETEEALTRLRRMYAEIRDDRIAVRSQDSVRTLGRNLVAFSRTLQSGPLPGARTSGPQLSIPTEMKGVALLPQSERSAALRQRICPVTGGPLGSMGKPIRTTVAGRTVYVCCQGCIATLQQNPQRYLAALNRSPSQPSYRNNIPSQRPAAAAISIPDDMKGVRLLPAGEQAIAMQQRTCPVMNTPLGSMGKPIRVTVGGRSTYVCCQGCVDSVRQNPGKYLR